jgi:Protein of unknown function (DUF1634)
MKMTSEPKPHVDNLARAVHVALLTGLIPSGLLMAIGLIVALTSGQPRPDAPPPGIGVLIRQALAGQGVSLLALGTVFLMLTPLLRVIVLALGWALRRDWRFALIAFTVLTLLTISLTLGFG